MKATLVSVDEYLHSSYDPDCDYVDGELVERNVGEKSHSKWQGAIYSYYKARKKTSGLHPFIELRIRISEHRYRVPDVCLTVGEPPEEVFTRAPLAVFEILSPEDRMRRMQEKIDDYLSIGVRYIWVIDPTTRRVYAYTPEGSHEEKSGVLRTQDPDTELPLSEIYRDIDE